MKINPAHYAALRLAIKAAIDHAKVSHPDVTESSYAAAGLSAKRYRWDLFWLANSRHGAMRPLVCDIYTYANDSHIDTALRSIIKEFSNVKT